MNARSGHHFITCIRHLGLPMGWPTPVHALYSVLLKVKGKVHTSPVRLLHSSTSRALVTAIVRLNISLCMLSANKHNY